MASHCLCMPPSDDTAIHTNLDLHTAVSRHACLAPAWLPLHFAPCSGAVVGAKERGSTLQDRHTIGIGVRVCASLAARLLVSHCHGQSVSAVAIGFGDRTLTVCGGLVLVVRGRWARGSGCASSLFCVFTWPLLPQHLVTFARCQKPASRWDHPINAGRYELDEPTIHRAHTCKLMALVAKLHMAIATSSQGSAVFRVKGGR